MRRSLVPILFAKPGWVLPGATLDMDFANNRAWRKGGGLILPASLLTTTRASTGYAATSSGLLVPFSANIPRITDQLLVEQAATNLALQSVGFSTSAAGGSGGTVTQNFAAGPDGTATASRYQWSNNSNFWNASVTAVSAQTYTLSAYFKINSTLSSTVQFGISDGTNVVSITLTSAMAFSTSSNSGVFGAVSNPLVTTYANGWSRIQFTVTSSGISGSTHPFVGPGTNAAGDILVWGAQLETGTFPTSYIPTTTVSVTRAADNITAALGSWFVPGQGTMLAKMLLPSLPPTVSSGSTFAAFNDGSNNNRLQLYMNNGAANPNTISTSGGVNQYVGNPGGGPSANIAFKIAMRWAASSYGSAVNGGAENTQASGSVPSGLTQLVFGASGSGYPNGYVQRFVYARSPLNTTSLTALP